MTVSLDSEVYGGFARFSAVADFLELCALKSKRLVRQPDLERWFEKEGIRLASPLGPNAEDAAQSAAIVFDTLRERAQILGGLYPFEVSAKHGLLARKKAVGSYRLLLALTAGHAHSISCGEPTQLFEGFVARVLVARGLRAAITGTSRRRDGTGFAGMLDAACKSVGLTATPDAVVISASAKDENVDVLAHLDWNDPRPGRWTFIGQATIARSHEWEGKAAEPSPKAWGRLVTDTLQPRAFLAVPHHVERQHLTALHERDEAIMLDRLRLVQTTVKLTTEDRALVAAVAEEQVEW